MRAGIAWIVMLAFCFVILWRFVLSLHEPRTEFAVLHAKQGQYLFRHRHLRVFAHRIVERAEFMLVQVPEQQMTDIVQQSREIAQPGGGTDMPRQFASQRLHQGPAVRGMPPKGVQPQWSQRRYLEGLG